MLCKFCSDIDIDELCSPAGYKHHSSYGNLISSAKNVGCESCVLICTRMEYRTEQFYQQLPDAQIILHSGTGTSSSYSNKGDGGDGGDGGGDETLFDRIVCGEELNKVARTPFLRGYLNVCTTEGLSRE